MRGGIKLDKLILTDHAKTRLKERFLMTDNDIRNVESCLKNPQKKILTEIHHGGMSLYDIKASNRTIRLMVVGHEVRTVLYKSENGKKAISLKDLSNSFNIPIDEMRIIIRRAYPKSKGKPEKKYFTTKDIKKIIDIMNNE